MKIERQKVETFVESIYCSECNEEMKSTGFSTAGNPPMFSHVCKNQHYQSFDKAFPRNIYENLPIPGRCDRCIYYFEESGECKNIDSEYYEETVSGFCGCKKFVEKRNLISYVAGEAIEKDHVVVVRDGKIYKATTDDFVTKEEKIDGDAYAAMQRIVCNACLHRTGEFCTCRYPLSERQKT